MSKSGAPGRPNIRRRMGCALVLVIAATAMTASLSAFRSDLRHAENRLAGRSRVVMLSPGPLEYAEQGKGPPLMMIHGTGGGFDQGLAFSMGIAANGIKVIAPSRFGYLRSSWPEDPSAERQADALAELLDHLRIERVAVAGGSAGALSAVQFALRHPSRTKALILIVPAANVEGRDPNRMTPAHEWLVRRLMTSDFLFWAARKLLPEQLVGFLLATDPRLLEAMPLEERGRAYRILDQILPISRRWRGMLNDAKLAGHPAPVEFSRLRVPLLILSAEDDRFGTAGTARAIAARVKGSRLVVYPSGGHIFVGRQAESAAEIARFVRTHEE